MIGNVENGLINAFNPKTGAFVGTLAHPDGTPIVIPGLWDLAFGDGSPANGKTNELFFTAGPNAVTFTGNGLFGEIIAAGDQAGSSATSMAIPALANLGQGKASAPTYAVIATQQLQRATRPMSALRDSGFASNQIAVSAAPPHHIVTAKTIDLAPADWNDDFGLVG